jgi:Flp pilus assembly protein CpaB
MARRIFEAVVGVVLLVVAFVLAFLFQQAYKSGVEYKSLPVPIQEIPPYTILTDKMFEMKDFPSALTGGYASSVNQLTGNISNSRIPAGLPVPMVMVSRSEDFRLADPSLEVVSIPVSLSQAVGGQVKVGDRVNIYLLIPPGRDVVPVGETEPIMDPVTLVAENIPVVMVLGDDGGPAGLTDTGRFIPAHILVLAVTQDQLGAILNLMSLLQHDGVMWVTLTPIPE